MPRIAQKLVVATAFLTIVACNDKQPVGLIAGRASANVVTPVGTLDQNISGLLGLFSGNGALAQWKNVKRKYADGQSDPQQLAVSKTMLVNLVDWVNKHSDDMSTPPGGETKQAAAARVILYMSEYVYNGPTFTPPAYTPAADVAVGIVAPTSGDTIVTPNEVAGIGLESGSVAEPTIIVVSQNPTPYPANCSGPLQTKLCQYPRFYKFDQFPHVKLLKPAKVSVCHINGGTERTPLADHNRFRLAHTLPASAADYTPGSTVRNTGGEAVEILPLITQTFVSCGDVEMTASGLRHTAGPLTRLAKGIVKFFAPKTAYAIDQGFGGSTLEFSDFNDLDPDGVPDRAITTATFSPGPYHQGDHVTVNFRVKNVGTATATSVPVNVIISPDSAFDPSDITVASAPTAVLAPGDSIGQVIGFVIPPTVGIGSKFIGIQLGDDPTMPDTVVSNNKSGVWGSFQASFVSLANTRSIGEESDCALTSAGSMQCWGDNSVVGPYHEYGTTQPSSNSPVPVTVPAFATFATGHSQHRCVITATQSAICWGRGNFGQLGRGTLEPIGNNPAAVVGGISWAQVSTGRISTCGVSTTGAGYCWGPNQRGEIGSVGVPLPIPYNPGPPPSGGTFTRVPTPHLVDGGYTWKTIVAGWIHACGITTSGQTYCWGDNALGQLGIGTQDTLMHPTPQLVAGGLQFIQLSLFGQATCGITVQHDAYCWGENALGQLGNGTSGVPAVVPTLVSGGLKFSLIATGSGFGDGTSGPLPVVPSQANKGFVCALTERGEAYCWGGNWNGQLGNGTLVNSSVPVAVAGGHLFTGLQAGGAMSCGMWFNQIWCWGSNAVGQLGNGTFINSSIPTLVSSPFDVP